jgi:predicted permease
VDVEPLLEYLVGGYRTLLGVVFAAAGLVLLIACTNLLSAQLARAWSREREVLVRAALGASRTRLLRQLTVESALLVAIGSALGIGLAIVLTTLVRTVGAGQLPRLAETSIDARVVVVAIGVMVFVTVAVGLYPAFRLSRSSEGLAARGARGSAVAVRISAWRALLGFEIALAVALSVGATLLVRTFRNIVNADTGFSSQGVVTAAITPSAADAARLDEALVELSALPGAEGAAYTTRLPLSWGSNSGPVRRPTDPAGPEWPAMAGFRMVSPGYFETLRHPVLRGRSFTAGDRAGAAKVAIITPGIAEKLWPGEDAVGKTIGTNYLWDQWLSVVGVVAEASSWSMPRGAQNEIFVPIAQHVEALGGQGQLVAVMRTSLPEASAMPAAREALKRVLPNSPAQLGTMEDRIASSAADRRFAMVALTAFAAIALLLAAIGIHGVIWYIVTTRVQELGVRMALGATPGAILSGVLGGAAAVAGIGVVLGAVTAMAGGRFLESTLYGVSRLDPGAYLASAGVVVLAVLVGAWIPARRASRVDPMVAMRSEV